MKIQINTSGVFDYLKFSPPLGHSESGEEWKDKAVKFPKPYVSLPFGEADLPLPLRSLGIILRGNGFNYMANACIVTGSQINFDKLSEELLNTIPPGLSWKPVRKNQTSAYIYNQGESTPSFAFSSARPGRSNLPVFTMFMGTNGSRARSIGLEDEFIYETNSFGNMLSYFISACFESGRKTRTCAREIEVPSILEFTCWDTNYSL